MPEPFAGFGVETDEAVREEIVAGVGASVVVAGGHFNRNINVTELFIGSEGRPGPGVAGEFPGITGPGVVAEFARLRNGMEGPDELAGVDIVAADVARNVFFCGRGVAGEERRTHNDNVADDDGRGTGADGSRLDDGAIQILREIHNAVAAEPGDGRTVLCIQGDHLVAGRDHDDAFVGFAIRPVSEATVHLAGDDGSSGAFIQAIHPERFAGSPIDRHRVATDAGSEV